MAQWIKRGICVGLIFLMCGCHETKVQSILKIPDITTLRLDYPYLNQSLDGKSVELNGEIYQLQVFDDAFCVSNERQRLLKEETCVPITAIDLNMEIDDLYTVISDYFHQMGISHEQVSYFYENLITGDTVSWNLEHEYLAASTIKLGMAMLYTDLMNEGSLPSDLKIAYYPELDFEPGLGEIQYQPAGSLLDVDFILEQMILNSDNCALNMLARTYTDTFHEDFRIGLNRYLTTPFTMEDAYVNKTTPQKMWELMDVLVANPSLYADILEDMSHAYEGRYLKQLDIAYPIYQKWGYYSGYSHVLGIIETQQPFIVGIYTEMLYDGEAVIADLADLMVRYNMSHLNDGFYLNGEKIYFSELLGW